MRIKPAINKDSFWGDVANTFLMRPAYREPAKPEPEEPKSGKMWTMDEVLYMLVPLVRENERLRNGLNEVDDLLVPNMYTHEQANQLLNKVKRVTERLRRGE